MIEWDVLVLIGIGAAVAFFVAMFLDKLIQVPVQIYKELGGFDKQNRGFEAQNVLPPPTSSGKLRASITIHGTYEKTSFHSSFDLEFTYKSGMNIICDKKWAKIILDQIVWDI